MLENPLKILIKKQMCSTMSNPHSPKTNYFGNQTHQKTAIKNPLKNFHIDADCHFSSC